MKNFFKSLLRKPAYVYFPVVLLPYGIWFGIFMLFGLGFYKASFAAVVFYIVLAIICFRPLLEAAIEAGIEDGFASALNKLECRKED